MVMAATTTAQALSEALWLVLRNFITLFGIVRSEASKQALVEAEGVPKDHVLVADVTLAEAVKDAVQKAIAAGLAVAVGEKDEETDVLSFAFSTSYVWTINQ